MNYITNSLIPIILVIIVFYGMIKGKKVYEWFLEGAKEGLYLFCENISISIGYVSCCKNT